MEIMKEEWRDIPDYEGLYQVSNMGKVKSFERNGTKGGILKPSKSNLGYMRVVLSKNNLHKNVSVHRLVALAFIQNPENLPCVNHKNEIKTDNRVENLEWCTKQYNNCYGTRLEKVRETSKGKSINSKPILQYTKDMIFIREWISGIQASQELNIDRRGISMCCNGKQKTCGGFIWKHK